MFKVNYSNKYFTKNGEKLQSVDMRELFEYYSNLPPMSKNQYGGIYCYNNPTKGESELNFNGLFFIDIDTKGINQWISDRIFNYSDRIFLKMPNILCIKLSYSKGIHVIVFNDESIDGVEDYKRKCMDWMAFFTYTVRKQLDIDLAEYHTEKGLPVLDVHNINPYQQLGLSGNPYKWNEYHCSQSLDKVWKKTLREAYPQLYSMQGELDPNRKVETDLLKKYREGLDTTFNEEVPRTIDANFTRYGYSGDGLRRKIAMCLLIRCGWEVEDATELCNSGFDKETAKQINAWIKTYSRKELSNNGGFVRWMKWLFKEDKTKDNYVELKRHEYLNQVLDVNKIDYKYLYIVSNTGTGKTEWIKRIVDENDDVIAVSPNLAILEGKKGGDGIKTRNISSKVFNNKEKMNKSKGMMTTMDRVGRMNKEDLTDKILIVDEAHLLTTYLGMKGKLEAMEKILLNMDVCKKVIFLSATPSGERYIRPFKVISFIKKTNANVIIHTKKLDVDGVKGKKGGVYVPCYKRIINDMMKERHVIVFSNRKRGKWDEAGIQQLIDDKAWGEYNSTIKNAKGKNECYEMLKGEEGNKMLYDWIFATCFLGVGVEVKCDKDGNRIRDGHVVFFVDEGFDVSFIEQCIGRFRDMEDEMINIHVHLYYTKNTHPTSVYTLEDYKGKCARYYEEAVGMEDEGGVRYNILMQRFFGVSGKKVNPELNNDVHEAIGKMMAYKIYNEKHYASVEDVITHIGKLPYKKIEVMEEEEIEVNSDGKRYNMKEKEFGEYVMGLNKGALLSMLENYGTNELMNKECGFDIPFKNYSKVSRYIDVLRKIYKRGWDVYEWIQFAKGEISKIEKMYRVLKIYMLMKSEDSVIDNKDDFEFVGSEEVMKKGVKEAELIFEKWFLDEVVNKRDMGLVDKMEIEIDPIFADVMGLEDEKDENDRKMFLDVGDVKRMVGKAAAKTYEITMNGKLDKYGLKKGMIFKGKKEILDYVKEVGGYKIDETYIKRWRKSRYIISY